MRIYLAAAFTAREEMLGVREVLTAALGHTVTSSWLDQESGPAGLTPDVMNARPATCAPYALLDMRDVLDADTLIVFTCYGPSTTGGRHVELGMALTSAMRIILVGPRENIFQTLPTIEHYPDWPHLAGQLSAEHFDERSARLDAEQAKRRVSAGPEGQRGGPRDIGPGHGN